MIEGVIPDVSLSTRTALPEEHKRARLVESWDLRTRLMRAPCRRMSIVFAAARDPRCYSRLQLIDSDASFTQVLGDEYCCCARPLFNLLAPSVDDGLP
jgi:hypothetical protein